ncbi:MAG: hypothetical protein V7739_20830 [Motiliproteus sp.]
MGVDFEAWHLWVILALTLAALEMLGMGFVALAAAVACLAGAALALADQPFWIQLAATAVAAAVLTPLFIRWYGNIGGAKENVSVTGDSGSQGQEAEIVSRQERLGVIIKGDFFPAQLDSKGAIELAVGQRVEVIRFEGITAQVKIL